VTPLMFEVEITPKADKKNKLTIINKMMRQK